MKYRPNWACSSAGPRNNELLKQCSFEFFWDPNDVKVPNCPTCGSKLSWVSDGPSVSDLMRRGMLENK